MGKGKKKRGKEERRVIGSKKICGMSLRQVVRTIIPAPSPSSAVYYEEKRGKKKGGKEKGGRERK